MGFHLFSHNGKIQYGIKNYIADYKNDLNNIPCAPGNMVYVIEESKYYIANNKKEWIEHISITATSISDPTDEIDIVENGNYNVAKIGTVHVNIPQPSGKITFTENGTDINIEQYATADIVVPEYDDGG